MERSHASVARVSLFRDNFKLLSPQKGERYVYLDFFFFFTLYLAVILGVP